ncbi:MAG: Chorismate pyruvate-lyase [Methanonatronarchaeales archaeon]|nr:Chorismate pyruvate-lyase [Methanonatronarchaeales archaeon]
MSNDRPPAPLELLRSLKERGIEPSLEERILLGTDGSVTFLLEVLTGDEVGVETLEQRVVPATAGQAASLGIDTGDGVNVRRVVLRGDRPLVYAESLTPVGRLEPRFREALLRRDKPIGRIMAELSIEARRDIKELGVTESGPGADVLGREELFYREYDITRNGEVLMQIREEFPSGLFD